MDEEWSGPGWSHCAYGWMADYKGYWFKKSKKGCGSGKGFRNGKKVKKLGAYCCNLAMNSQKLGRILDREIGSEQFFRRAEVELEYFTLLKQTLEAKRS